MSEDIMSQVTQWLANIQVLHAVLRQRRTCDYGKPRAEYDQPSRGGPSPERDQAHGTGAKQGETGRFGNGGGRCVWTR